MAEYTVKVEFHTAAAGKGKGAVTGSLGKGEIDITADGPVDTSDPDFIEGCKQFLMSNHKIKGTIISLKVVGIERIGEDEENGFDSSSPAAQDKWVTGG